LLVTESVLDRSNFAPQLAQCIESSLMLAPQTVHCFMAVEVVIELLHWIYFDLTFLP
jgi:hypothetical protein